MVVEQCIFHCSGTLIRVSDQQSVIHYNVSEFSIVAINVIGLVMTKNKVLVKTSALHVFYFTCYGDINSGGFRHDFGWF